MYFYIYLPEAREVPSRQAQWGSARCAQLVSEADHAPQAHMRAVRRRSRLPALEP